MISTKMVSELTAGMKIDLAGDKYADPDNTDAYFESMYVVVDKIVQQTPDCIVVYGEIEGVWGFPPKHEVIVAD